MLIRTAALSDASVIDAMLVRSYPPLLSGDYSQSTLDAVIPMIARSNPAMFADKSYFVLEISGRIVGAAGWTHAIPGTTDIEKGRGNIRRVIVEQGFQRRGIAQALMSHCHAHARNAGMTWMHVLSTLTAESFYKAMGYVLIGPVDVALGPDKVPFPSLAMSRFL